MLRLEKVSAAYGAVDALREIDLSIETGEIVALIGSNGAGKSTLLKTISGLVRPSTGMIEFLGAPIAGLPPEHIVELGIIQVPEGRRVFPRLTVHQNLSAGAYSPELTELNVPHARGSSRLFRVSTSGGASSLAL
jgi:branched-chain amino acid transport system ATP-binding protein